MDAFIFPKIVKTFCKWIILCKAFSECRYEDRRQVIDSQATTRASDGFDQTGTQREEEADLVQQDETRHLIHMHTGMGAHHGTHSSKLLWPLLYQEGIIPVFRTDTQLNHQVRKAATVLNNLDYIELILLFWLCLLIGSQAIKWE